MNVGCKFSDESVEIGLNSFALLALAFALLWSCAFELYMAYMVYNGGPWSIGYALLSALGLLVLGVIPWFIAATYFTGKPCLIIDRQGLTVLAAFGKQQFIPWTKIKEIYWHYGFLQIALNNGDAPYSTVRARGLAIDPDDLMKLIRKFRLTDED